MPSLEQDREKNRSTRAYSRKRCPPLAPESAPINPHRPTTDHTSILLLPRNPPKQKQEQRWNSIEARDTSTAEAYVATGRHRIGYLLLPAYSTSHHDERERERERRTLRLIHGWWSERERETTTAPATFERERNGVGWGRRRETRRCQDSLVGSACALPRWMALASRVVLSSPAADDRVGWGVV